MHPSVQDPEAQAGPDTWITEIRTYLKDNILPDDMTSADQIARLAKRYTLVEGDLYRRGGNGVLMRCITLEEGYELLAEVHGGECGNHASSRTLVGKAFRHRFYWPTALQDAVELVKTCKACQFHAKQIHMSAQMLQMIPPSWPFAVWGAGHRGAISPCRRRVPIHVCRHQQVHQVSGSNPSGQNADSGSQTGSSSTMGPSLLVVPSKGTAKI
jgi:hypothetical protein